MPSQIGITVTVVMHAPEADNSTLALVGDAHDIQDILDILGRMGRSNLSGENGNDTAFALTNKLQIEPNAMICLDAVRERLRLHAEVVKDDKGVCPDPDCNGTVLVYSSSGVSCVKCGAGW